MIVIPARFGSKRLPGKPLVKIAGHTLLERVVHVASKAARLVEGCDVVVATDDPRIAEYAQTLKCEVMMTSPDISSGSGRAFAAAKFRTVRPEIVVNLQGDVPFIPAEMVAAIVGAARASDAACVTPVVQLDWQALDAMRTHKIRSPFSGTSCVRRSNGEARWFSKSILPAIRDERTMRERDSLSPVFRHIGLYAYKFDALQRFEATPPSYYEQLEGLEQLRFLEMGLAVQTIEVEPPIHAISGIDTIDDVALAEILIERLGDPYRP